MKILSISPHPDDSEIGCFGTLARYKAEGHEVAVVVLTNGSRGGNNTDRMQEAQDCCGIVPCTMFEFLLQDGSVQFDPVTIDCLEQVRKSFAPDVVILPSPNDTHQDHQAVCSSCLVAFRDVDTILFYQTPSTTIKFTPNLYVDITNYMDKKIKAVKMHQSQKEKSYMAERAILGLSEFHGFNIRRGDRLFEGFEVYRSVM